MARYRHFRTERMEGVWVLHLTDTRFSDRLAIAELQDELVSFLKEEQPAKVLINFAAVQALSSETINTILRAREWIVANNGQLKLCDMRKEIRELFVVSKLEGTLFEIWDSMFDALDAFS